MPSVIQPSFARGEIAPGLYGRVDTSVYQIGLRTAWNTIVHAYGGISNRMGLRFVGPCKTHNATSRLIRFKFKDTDTYMLEFGALYMRVIRGDAHVVETAVSIIAPVTATNPVVITATAHGYSNGDEVFISGAGGMIELNGRHFIVAGKTNDTFQLHDQVLDAAVDGTSFAAYTSGGTVARVFQITTPYAQGDLSTLKFTQSADTMTITHPSYDPVELTRTDHDAWTIPSISFGPEQANPTALAATQNGAAGSTIYKYRVTAIADETFEESLPGLNTTTKTIISASKTDPVIIGATAHGFLDGEEVFITGIVGMTELNGRRFTVANKNNDDFELKDEDGQLYGLWTSGGTAQLTFAKVTNGNATLTVTNNVTLTWTEAANAQRYAVYKDDNGLYGLLGETESTTFVDNGSKTPDLDSGPPRVREPFKGANNRPASVGYFQQRRVFGGSNNLPDTSDYTRTGDQSNMSVATPSRADDAIRATLTSSEVNAIRHYVALDDLLILTAGEEWRINSGDDSRFSSDTIKQKSQSSWGSGHQRPIVLGRTILFVQENNATVRSLGFELTVDGYTGTDMTILANHLFRFNTLTDWAHVRSPDPIVYGVRSDGIATTMTFDAAQEVVAWTRWGTRTPDKFENVSTIRPSSSDVDDAAYFIVKRTINGNTVRYIERVANRRKEDVRDMFYVDCGITLDNPFAISASTKASPVVLTVASGHGMVADDEVDISDIIWVPDVDAVSTETQPAQLNNGRFKVKSQTATTITLKSLADVDVDGSAFNAYVSGGKVRKAVDTVTGLQHLANENVIALADGSVVRGLTVSVTGSLTFPRKFSRAHIGFGYYSDVELLDIETRTASGSIQGFQMNVYKIVVRMEASRGLWAGPNAADLTEIAQRQFEAYGEPTRLFTGDIDVPLMPEWNSNGRVLLRQRDPLPMNLLLAMPFFRTEAEDPD